MESRKPWPIKVELPYPLLPTPDVVPLACIATAVDADRGRDACQTILGGQR